jgi:nicotinate-nucleotide--dimethylbenzimidazole phosphoribosyltransferase
MPPPVPLPAAVAVFAGDHGVLAQGVTPWPKEVTAQMVANFLAGGAAINVLADLVGATVTVVDVGVDAELASAPGLRRAKIRPGTDDLAAGPAMSRAEAQAALDVGAAVAADLVGGGARCLVTGDMGIGNTTPSAAVVAALAGRPAAEVTGRGTGIDDATLDRKIAAVEAGLARLAPGADAVDVVAEIGGLEIAAIAGFVIGGAAARTPVVVDGVIALAGACVAVALAPDALGYCVAGHRSTEPGATAALEHLGLEPLLDLGLRLGEGTGACLAVPLLVAAARVLGEMATFDGAGVTKKV